ncbi:hypothetical protein AOLI_G00236230 [Acnodon oligacanthus]
MLASKVSCFQWNARLKGSDCGSPSGCQGRGRLLLRKRAKAGLNFRVSRTHFAAESSSTCFQAAAITWPCPLLRASAPCDVFTIHCTAENSAQTPIRSLQELLTCKWAPKF